MKLPRVLFLLLLLLFWTSQQQQVVVGDNVADSNLVSVTCSADENLVDPNLVEMKYDVGDGPQTFMAYVEPDVASFYRNGDKDFDDDSADDEEATTRYQKVVPKFNGLAGKFINMSNQRLVFYWESKVNGPAHAMRVYDPWSNGGTGTFPGHRFFFAPEDDPDTRLVEFLVADYPNNLYVYDPYKVDGDPEQTERNLQKHLTTKEDRDQYEMWKRTLLFHETYKNTTGRSYLANYGEQGFRKPPGHFMWPASYFGQEHWVMTKETHFTTVPPEEKLQRITKAGSSRVLREDEPRILQEYRVPDQTVMNMTLKVLSCAPRVFEIENFLSQAEVDHVLDLAGGIELKESTTGDVGSSTASKTIKEKEEEGRQKTRTSFNSWVPREDSPIIDAIYRRSADLVRIDEALMRARSGDEYPDLTTKKSIAESLQLVHYGVGQEYTAHHDFGYSNIKDNHMGARYATLLFYLNEGMDGGETTFPRWVNGETFHKLSVTPEVGKAVLFYSQLPDGNMDDFSQHSAEPIINGEKWLINLWIWEPVYEK